MGRPLKKKFFGNPDKEGLQLVLSSTWLPGKSSAEAGYWVVRQVGTGRYQVTNGTDIGVVNLVDVAPEAEGQATLEVTLFGGAIEYARVIYNRTVSTWNLRNYRWSLEPASEEGEANLNFEPAGDDYTDTEALDDVNAATTPEEIVAIISDHPEFFLDEEQAEDFEVLLPNSRQVAVGAGVAEWAEMFGEFTDADFLKETVALHVRTEANKQTLQLAADAAVTFLDMKDAYEEHLQAVVDDRTSLIADLRASGVTAAETRADELEIDDFTTILAAFQVEVGFDRITDELYQYILDERNALSNSKFFGYTRMLPILNDVLTAG